MTETQTATLPRVTEVLKNAGLIDTRWFSDEVRDRGTVVHAACQYLDEGTLDESTLDPKIAGYVEGYKRWIQWRQATGQREWDWIEAPRQDPQGRYRGTPDRILTVRPRWVWDIKTGCHFPWHALQTAAYVNMLPNPYSYRRAGLYLKADGHYQVREYPRDDYARDLSVFLAAVTCTEWRLHHEH